MLSFIARILFVLFAAAIILQIIRLILNAGRRTAPPSNVTADDSVYPYYDFGSGVAPVSAETHDCISGADGGGNDSVDCGHSDGGFSH